MLLRLILVVVGFVVLVWLASRILLAWRGAPRGRRTRRR